MNITVLQIWSKPGGVAILVMWEDGDLLFNPVHQDVHSKKCNKRYHNNHDRSEKRIMT